MQIFRSMISGREMELPITSNLHEEHLCGLDENTMPSVHWPGDKVCERMNGVFIHEIPIGEPLLDCELCEESRAANASRSSITWSES